MENFFYFHKQNLFGPRQRGVGLHDIHSNREITELGKGSLPWTRWRPLTLQPEQCWEPRSIPPCGSSHPRHSHASRTQFPQFLSVYFLWNFLLLLLVFYIIGGFIFRRQRLLISDAPCSGHPTAGTHPGHWTPTWSLEPEGHLCPLRKRGVTLVGNSAASGEGSWAARYQRADDNS